MTICANHVGWLQRFIISVDSFHFNSETMRYCILMYSAESLAPKSILQPLVKLPMLVLGPMIFVDPLYQGISRPGNRSHGHHCRKIPAFFPYRNVTSIQSKTIFHCQPFLSFSVELYLCRLLWKTSLTFRPQNGCRVRFVIEVRVFSVKTHTSLAVSGTSNSYTYSTLFSTCRLDNIWMYQKNIGNYPNKRDKFI